MRQKKKQCMLCLIILVFCLVFVSCKSEEATEVDELISAIGTVTLDSEQAIETAEVHYLALTEKQKEQVENNVTLVQARRDYDKLWNEEQARLKAEEEARIKAEEEARLKAEAEEAAKKEKQALERSKHIFTYINLVYPLINQYSNSLQEAWSFAINNAYALSTDNRGKSIGMVATAFDLSEEEVRDAMSFAMWRLSTQEIGMEMDYFDSSLDSTANELRNLLQSDDAVNTYFMLMNAKGASGASGALMIMESIYLKNNSFDDIDNKLNIIKNKLKEIRDDSPDYEHYETLEKCYSALKNFIDYCRNFQGNYQTVSATFGNFRTEIQGYINSLEYAFDT